MLKNVSTNITGNVISCNVHLPKSFQNKIVSVIALTKKEQERVEKLRKKLEETLLKIENKKERHKNKLKDMRAMRKNKSELFSKKKLRKIKDEVRKMGNGNE